ncbi:MAG: type II toxin-antitoxin system PemK/MazF family toxin [Meiothermus sp.]|nr:type II toxin-antitoxin system PemK/MazF family toxin [Meiothermus sp.]
MNLERGDIVFVDFGDRGEREVSFKRPAVVVTNNFANAYAPLVTVVPITSRGLDNVYPMQLFLPRDQTGLSKDSKAQVELIGHIRKDRILRREGRLTPELLMELDRRIREHLAL